MPISLTEAGQSLANRLDKVLSAYGDLQSQMKTLSSSQKDITVIGYMQPIDPDFASGIYRNLYAKKLSEQLKIIPIDGSRALDRLKNDSMDFYIGPQLIDRRVDSEVLEHRQLSLLVPLGSTAQFIGSKKELDTYGVLKRFLSNQKIDTTATIQVNNQWDAAFIAHKSGLLALVDPALIALDPKKQGNMFSRFVKLPAEYFSFNIYLSYLTTKLKEKLPVYQQVIAASREKALN